MTKQPVLSVLDAIYLRRAVRAYQPKPVDAETIRKLLDAAVQAPTAIHLEPWAFVVVQDAERLRRYSDRAKAILTQDLHAHQDLRDAAGKPRARGYLDLLANPDFSIFYDAGTLIVICAKPLSPYVTADCWLAAENLMLAACALGLGTCPIGFAVAVLNTPEVKAELGIPPELTAVAPIIVGVPSGAPAAGARKPPEILSWK